jgi:hypothetical protein
MIDFSSLPSSEAELLNEINASTKGVRFTDTESVDERNLYSNLNKRLTILETSLEIDKKELNAIQQESDSFRVSIEEKEEVMLRIDWLRRLYEVKEAIQSVETKEHAEQLRTKIASVQTCPMKNELLAKLDSLVKSLPSEQTEQPQLSPEQELMEKAIVEAGDAFINLGRAGREYVVTKVIEEFGKDVPVASIQEAVSALEEQVARLAGIDDVEELQTQLETLPLSNYSRLSSERKQTVAEKLIENRQWKGLASLDRLIHQLDAKLSVAEEQEVTKSMESGVATALDFNRLDGLVVQIR